MRLAKVVWLLAALVWVPALVVLAPKFLEIGADLLDPPLAGVRFTETTLDSENAGFRLAGTKLTNDRLVTMTAAWMFVDRTLMPAALVMVDEASGIGHPIRVAGEMFLSRAYTVRVPTVARTAAGTELRVCFIYDRAGLFCVETPFMSFVEVP